MVLQQQQVFTGQHVSEQVAAESNTHRVNPGGKGGGAEECTLDMLPSSSSAPR